MQTHDSKGKTSTSKSATFGQFFIAKKGGNSQSVNELPFFKPVISNRAPTGQYVQRQVPPTPASRPSTPSARSNISGENQRELGQMTDQLTSMRQEAENRLDINVNSWDAWILNSITPAVNRRFQNQQIILDWIDYAQVAGGVLVDLNLASPNPIQKVTGIVVKAMIAAGRFISREIIANGLNQSRSDLTTQTIRLFRESQDDARRSGRSFIGEFLQEHPLIGGAELETAATREQLYNEVNRRYPQITVSGLSEISAMIDQIFLGIYQHAEEARQTLARAAQVRRVMAMLGVRRGQIVDRPGGLPTEEEARRANTQARQETLYTGPDITLSEIYGGPH